MSEGSQVSKAKGRYGAARAAKNSKNGKCMINIMYKLNMCWLFVCMTCSPIFGKRIFFKKFSLSSFILGRAAQYALHEFSPLTALMTVARKMTPNIMRAPNCFENS